MKKYITTFLLLFIPFVSMAADHCTNPTEYTIDRRCYVTNAQKQKKPYNAVVALVDGEYVYCTGTIKDFKGAPYIYTAKHCVNNKDGTIKKNIYVRTQNGSMFVVNENRVGDYVPGSRAKDRSGDLAIYSISAEDQSKIIASTEFSSNSRNSQNTYKARVIGYGALKIMSDKDINQFKQKYRNYLKNQKGIISNGTEQKYGWKSGGLDLDSSYADNFVQYLRQNDLSYYMDTLKNTSTLKISRCTFSGAGDPKGCQIWGGNSGGGVFDDTGNLMGILGGYRRIIGGTQHSASSGLESVTNVNFLK